MGAQRARPLPPLCPLPQVNVWVGAFFVISGYVAGYTATEVGRRGCCRPAGTRLSKPCRPARSHGVPAACCAPRYLAGLCSSFSALEAGRLGCAWLGGNHGW